MAYDPDRSHHSADSDDAPVTPNETGVGFGQSPAVLRRGVDAVLARERMLWTIVVVAMVFDLLLTGVGLSLGLQERNPIARRLIESLGLLRAGLLLKGGVLAYGYGCWLLFPRLLPSNRRLRSLIPLGLAAPWWAVVVLNTFLVLSVV